MTLTAQGDVNHRPNEGRLKFGNSRLAQWPRRCLPIMCMRCATIISIAFIIAGVTMKPDSFRISTAEAGEAIATEAVTTARTVIRALRMSIHFR